MATEPVPGTPGIKEVRPDSGSDMFKFDTNAGLVLGVDSLSPSPPPGIRRVGLRAEIDTSPPFGSVKEAVTRFGGSGSWTPYYKLEDDYNGVEEFDLKKVEEQAAELEKDLIVKELETLDVLEELATTKKIVEELKRQLQEEALKCLAVPPPDYNSEAEHFPSSPAFTEINEQNNSMMTMMMGNSSPYHPNTASPDLILMELKQAKSNLGKTINDLGVIQSSVESLNKKMKNEKILLERTRERMNSQVADVSSLEEEVHGIKLRTGEESRTKKIAKASNFEDKASMKKTAEMRWVAAKKMEEAARAAEAVALADLRALKSCSCCESSSGYVLPEPEKLSLNLKTKSSSIAQEAHCWFKKKLAEAMFQIDEANASKLAILKQLKEATQEVNHSKQFLEEALNNVELANRKQLAAEEALQNFVPDHDKGNVAYNTSKLNNFQPRNSPINEMSRSSVLVNDLHRSKPLLRPNVSLRDVLKRKPVIPEDFSAKKEVDRGHGETHRVALSEMLHALREDLALPSKAEQKDGGERQRKRFGFIQISFPLSKPSKKKMHTLNTNVTH